MPITAVHKKRLGDGRFKVTVMVTGYCSDIKKTINASATFEVNGEDNVPFRGDHVDIVYSEGESSITYWNGWT